MARTKDEFPQHIRGQPQAVQLAVLYERVANLDSDVVALRRTLWVFITAIVTGGFMFVWSVASGWIGKTPIHTTTKVHDLISFIVGVLP